MKFFNSDKSGFLSFVAKRMKALFALLFIIAGVQTLSAAAALVKGDWDGWQTHDLIPVADNEYYVDIVMTNAATDEFGIDFNGSFYSLSNHTITNWCSFQKFYTNSSNCKFTHNAGTYRFRVWDDGNEKTLTITGIIVTIDKPVQNADGSYTITGRFTNANPSQQNIHTYQIVFSEGVGQGVGANETATVGKDGSFSITKQLFEEQQYTCCARAIDGSIGNHDSEYITFTAQAATPEPEPTVTDLYIFGVDNNWSNPSDEWKCTSVSQDGNVYTWNWSSAPKTFNGSTYFKVGAKNATNTGIDDNNNYGPSGSDVTLDFNGVQSIVQTVVNSSASKAFTVSAATEISQIVFDKSDLTVTFYAPVETPTPVYAATITADASASQQTARQVTLTSSLTEAAAGTDLTSATCQFQYLSADAAEGTEYSNLDAPVAYNADGTSLTTTALPQGGKYLFRAVWTLNGEVVATSEPSEATCVYPITPYSYMFDVQWEFATDPADLDVTITANIGVVEGSCLTMEQISKAPLECEIFVNEVSYRPQQTELVGDVMKATLTVAGLNASEELKYRMVLVTGAANASVVSAQGNMQIPGGTYVVEAPEVHNSTVYLRGDINGWAYDGIDDKYVGKTYDDVNVFWDWSDNPIEFESVGDNAGSKFKFDDTTDGEWETGQWSGGDQDAWIGEEQISNNKATLTTVNDDKNGAFYLVPEICPATISRIDLNVETNQLVITFDSYKQEFKDLWFRSPIVEGGWGDGISDPISDGVNPKYQGQTTDGKVYTWDWSGSKAVTLESGTEFKFGEYTGSSSWGNSGYAPNGQPSVTSADFGKEISVQVAAGNFSAGEKITITKITLNTETLKLELEGEQYKERFPVTVNTVNGEAGGTVTTEPADIGNMAIGETVTVTATAKEGYVALFEATSGCVKTDGSADNIKEFEITAANPVITVTFQVQCQTVETGFTISGRFNAGIEDADGLYQGSPISSRDADPADGYWSDGARFIQLTANSVPANYFEWECTTYAIDGVIYETIPDIAWTGQDKTSARAELSLPGTYTFVCNAKCNETDEWTESAAITITARVPEMGFDGPAFVGSSWDHASAGQENKGLMTRQNGSLVWKSRSLKVNGFTDADQFVIIQQYKRYGCTPNNGWNGWKECQAVIGNDWGNKINGSDLTFSYVKWEKDAPGSNFLPVNAGSWIAGADGTDLQLVVTMTGWDSYTVELAKKQEQIFANYSSNDVTKGTVAMKVGNTPIVNGADITAYIGQIVTLTATPALGYKVASWEINGKVTVSDRTTISPTLSGEGLNVVVTFKRDCYAGVAYDLTGGGVICANDGSTELSLNTLNNVTYQLYKDGAKYGEAVQGNGGAAKWTISEAGTYTAKAYDSRFEECQSQAIDMNGRAVVTTVTAPEITVNPGDNVHLTVLQARSFTAKVPVDWSIRSIPAGTGGTYCDGDGYMISSQTDSSLVAKFLCIGTAKITATMKAPNQKCKAEVTVKQNGAETEACAPEPEDMQ